MPVGRWSEPSGIGIVEWSSDASQWQSDSRISAREYAVFSGFRWTECSGLHVCGASTHEPQYLSRADRLQPDIEWKSQALCARRSDERPHLIRTAIPRG